MPLPGVETGIALSSLILGIGVAFALRPPLWVAAVIVGSFAIFHGHANGAEMPRAANAVTYALDFVVATGLLHLCGIVFGLLVRWSWAKTWCGWVESPLLWWESGFSFAAER